MPEIFVFGSNLSGIHGAGAAKFAAQHYGAIYGNGVGPQGESYAIPTKDFQINTLPLHEIKKYITDFILFSKENSNQIFHLTRVGCGLAGYKDRDIAPLFNGIEFNVKVSSLWIPFFPYHQTWTNI
jgi:hypothetical protein